MPYEKMATIIETYQKEIARMVINEMEAKNLISGSVTRDQLFTIITPVVARFGQYLRDGDVMALRDFIKTLAQTQLKNGNQGTILMQVGKIIFEKLRVIIERELPGPENEQFRQMYARRINGVNTLGVAAIINEDVRKTTNPQD